MQFQWSACELASPERFELWHSALRAAWNADFRVEAEPREISLRVMHAGPASIMEIVGATHRVARETPRRDGRVVLLLQIEGSGTVDDARRSTRLMPGGLCLLAPERCVSVKCAGHSRQLLVGVATEALDAAVPRWRELAGRTIGAAQPRLHEAIDLFRLLMDHHGELGNDCRAKLATKGLALLGEVIAGAHAGASRTGGDAHYARLADYHRERIDRYVVEHLREPELGVPRIAQALGLSVRYVHKLFEGGPPLMHRVSTQRLQGCQREITTRDGRPISDIAYSWGFNSPSHFSRAFKKHYGKRPSQA